MPSDLMFIELRVGKSQWVFSSCFCVHKLVLRFLLLPGASEPGPARPGPASSGEHLGAGTRHPAMMEGSGGWAGRHIAAELLRKSGLQICLLTVGNKSSQNCGGRPGELIG